MKSCDNCTKCCEGYLAGQAKGIPFYKGKPCYFVEIGKGCNIYNDRPKDPCVTYNCQWLLNKDLPDWIKPNKSGILITFRTTKNKIPYLEIIECSEKIDDRAVPWLKKYYIEKKINISITENNITKNYGSKKFLKNIES